MMPKISNVVDSWTEESANSIKNEIKQYMSQLDDKHELQLIIPDYPGFDLEEIGFVTPNIYLYGSLNGNGAVIIQNLSQINLCLMSKEISEGKEKRTIGFRC